MKKKLMTLEQRRLLREAQQLLALSERQKAKKRAASPSVAQRQSEHGAIILSGTRTQFAQRG